MKVYLMIKALIRKVHYVLIWPIKKVRLLLWKQLLKGYYLLLVPIDIYTILTSRRIHKTYRMSALRKFKLGLKMYRNTRRISTGTSYKAHLAMALKILETPPDVPGDVIECGTWKGGASANLSLVCKIVNRKLKVYDSFEGLPNPEPGDRQAKPNCRGAYLGTLNEVKSNIQRYGAIDCCEFVKGWFKDTLPKLDSPILLAFIDVDLEASLHACVKYIWPKLVDQGYMFTDESLLTDYVALFYSEKWWSKYFKRTPPGLIGAGTGLPLGQHYIGPWPGWSEHYNHPLQWPQGVSYTRKTLSGYWSYYPEGEDN